MASVARRLRAARSGGCGRRREVAQVRVSSPGPPTDRGVGSLTPFGFDAPVVSARPAWFSRSVAAAATARVRDDKDDDDRDRDQNRHGEPHPPSWMEERVHANHLLFRCTRRDNRVPGDLPLTRGNIPPGGAPRHTPAPENRASGDPRPGVGTALPQHASAGSTPGRTASPARIFGPPSCCGPMLGGTVVHPGERWAICKDSEGSPFGLALGT